MAELLRSLIVPALLIAVNPIPIIVAVTLLSAAHGRRNGGAFLATLVAIMLAVGLASIFLLGKADSSGQKTATTGQAALQAAFGLAFLVMFYLQWRAKPSPDAKAPKWMTMMDKAGFTVALILGLSLTNYALLSTGTSKILKSDLGPSEEVLALLFFILLAVCTVAVPLILYLVRRAWAEVQLARLRGWLEVHNRVLIMGVFLVMGVLFTAEGLGNLLS